MRVLSAGAAIPDNVITNADVEARLGLESGWIERRTGILQRPTAPSSEATSDLAVRAAAEALKRASMGAEEIGLLLLATSTPDHLLPPTAPLVAHRLGLPQAGAIDLAGACAGFLYALVLAGAWADNSRKSVLVVGANILTRRVNPTDPATVALFSDGAGALVVSPGQPSALLGSHLGCDGSGYDVIGIAAGGSRQPLNSESLSEGRHLMTMKRGPALFKHAVQAMADAGRAALLAAGLSPSDMDLWVPHQANTRIIEDAGKLLGIPSERTVNVVAQYGNSSAATIPIALNHAVTAGRLQQGKLVLLTAAGAGMVSSSAVLRW
jgi:3-oxoacyl-[acyl-carrier-protein] synthase III